MEPMFYTYFGPFLNENTPKTTHYESLEFGVGLTDFGAPLATVPTVSY